MGGVAPACRPPRRSTHRRLTAATSCLSRGCHVDRIADHRRAARFRPAGRSPRTVARIIRSALHRLHRGGRRRRARRRGDLWRPRAQRQSRLPDRLRPAVRGGGAGGGARPPPDLPDRAGESRSRRDGDARCRCGAVSAVRPAGAGSQRHPAAGRHPRTMRHRARPSGRRDRLEILRHAGSRSARQLDRGAGLHRRHAAHHRGRGGERDPAADGLHHRPARQQRDRPARRLRVLRLLCVGVSEAGAVRPAPRHDRVSGRRADAPERPAAWLPHHAIDRRPRGRPAQPERQGGRARRLLHHRGELLGQPDLARRLGGGRCDRAAGGGGRLCGAAGGALFRLCRRVVRDHRPRRCRRQAGCGGAAASGGRRSST